MKNKKDFLYNYTYKTTFLVGSLAGYYYLGAHGTNNLNDGYIGSGRKIHNWKHTHKDWRHKKDIYYTVEPIEFFYDYDKMFLAEKELVGNKWDINSSEYDPWCLNLKSGGDQNTTYSEESRKKISDYMKGHIPWNKGKTGIYSEESLKLMSVSHSNISDETREHMSIAKTGTPATWNMHPKSEETKTKISISLSEYFKDPEAHEKTSKTTSAAMKRPEVQEKLYKKRAFHHRRPMTEDEKIRNRAMLIDRHWINNTKECKLVKDPEYSLLIQNGWVDGRIKILLKYQDTDGNEYYMTKRQATRYHPDWILIEEGA